MAKAIITMNGVGGGTNVKIELPDQLGIYPIGSDGRPSGNVIIPEGVTSIYSQLFYSDTNLLSITFPNSLISVGRGAFYNCTNLQSINFSDNIEIIEQTAFRDCNKLTEITLPKNLRKIDLDAFYNCSLLTKINVPEEIEYLFLNDSFTNAPLNEKSIQDLAIKIMPYNGTIPANVFKGKIYLTNVVANYAGESMFEGCTSLQRVTINNVLNNIISNYFCKDCTSLNEIIYPENVTTLGTGCFYNCRFAEFDLQNVENIGAGAFQYNILLNTIHFSNKIKLLGDATNSSGVFSNCTNLKNITYDEDTKFYYKGNNIFKDCTSLTSQDVDNFFAHLDNAQAYNTSHEFNGCTGLVEPIHPKFLTNSMFYGCTNLTEVIGEQNSGFTMPITSIGNIFYNCTSLTKAILPDSVNSYASNIFYNCTNLREVYLPATITTYAALGGSVNTSHPFIHCKQTLEVLTLGDGWNLAINLTGVGVHDVDGEKVNGFSEEVVQAMFEALADRTGQTKLAFTLGLSNYPNLSEEIKAIATNKNWNLT